MPSKTEPCHVLLLAARRAQAKDPCIACTLSLSAGTAQQREQHIRRRLGSQENTDTATCFPINTEAAAGGRTGRRAGSEPGRRQLRCCGARRLLPRACWAGGGRGVRAGN